MAEELIGSWETKKTADTVRKTLDKKGYTTRIYRRKSQTLSNKPYEYTLYAMKPSKSKKYWK